MVRVETSDKVLVLVLKKRIGLGLGLGSENFLRSWSYLGLGTQRLGLGLEKKVLFTPLVCSNEGD